MRVLTAAASHSTGTNTANEGPACVPIEPVRREDPDAFRRRMEEKATSRRLHLRENVTPEPHGTVDEDLAVAKFDTPPLRDAAPVQRDTAPAQRDTVPVQRDAPRPTPRPRPAAAPPADEAARLDVLESYERGEGITALTRRLSVSETQVRRWLADAGVRLRSRAKAVAAAKALKNGEQVRPCAGGCGRSTRPGSTPVAQFPGTSPRVRDGLCGACSNPDANRREATPVERAEWARLHVEEGRTVPEIAEQVGRSQWTVRHGLRAHGVEVRTGQQIHRDRRAAGAPDAAPLPPASRKDPVVEARNERIVAMALAEPHTSASVIAARFGVGSAVVYNVLSKAGVRRREQRASRPAAPTPSRPPAAPSAPAPLSTPPAPDVEPTPVVVPLPAVATTPVEHYAAIRAAVVELCADLLDAAALLASASGRVADLRTAVADLLTTLPQEGPTP